MNWNLENSYAKLPPQLFTAQKLCPVNAPTLIQFNTDLANELGLSAYDEKTDLAILAGNAAPPGATPIAQAYCGHQFGNFVKLGDGRAVLLGEVVTASGRRYDVQLKGSGPTAYARRGDGRAALGPMLREYMISEAMHVLGVPTTRSLAVVTTGELTYRDRPLPGAVLTRIAASHIRVGTFQYAAALHDKSVLKQLADYSIARHFPDLPTDEPVYIEFLKSVCKRQAELIAKWMHVGFIHGVMNTDNMAISGESIDYGPCAFMDSYSADTVFSSIDTQGRYRYANQPSIGLWNLERFAETLLPLIDDDQDAAIQRASAALQSYAEHFDAQWLAGMRAKLGLLDEMEGDAVMISQWFALLEKYKADFTYAHRSLSFQTLAEYPIFQAEDFLRWYSLWLQRIQNNGRPFEAAFGQMRAVNPVVIPRNHLVEAVLLNAEAGDLQPLRNMLDVCKTPYQCDNINRAYAEPPTVDQGGYQTFCGT